MVSQFMPHDGTGWFGLLPAQLPLVGLRYAVELARVRGELLLSYVESVEEWPPVQGPQLLVGAGKGRDDGGFGRLRHDGDEVDVAAARAGSPQRVSDPPGWKSPIATEPVR